MKDVLKVHFKQCWVILDTPFLGENGGCHILSHTSPSFWILKFFTSVRDLFPKVPKVWSSFRNLWVFFKASLMQMQLWYSDFSYGFPNPGPSLCDVLVSIRIDTNTNGLFGPTVCVLFGATCSSNSPHNLNDWLAQFINQPFPASISNQRLLITQLFQRRSEILEY